MRLLTAVFFAAAAVCFAFGAAAQAYNIDGWIIDGEFPTRPGFPETPTVRFQVHNSDSPKPYEMALVRGQPTVRNMTNSYAFTDQIFGPFARAYIFFKIDVPGYTLAEAPGAGNIAVRQLPSVLASDGTVPVEFELVRRSIIADASRQEATAALDKANPGPADFERAEISARRAIEIDPTIDNYLNLFDIIRKANRTAYPELMVDFHSISALESLPGYADFSFEQKWRLQRELLTTLLRMPDHDAPLGFGGSVRDAAVSVGQKMVEQLLDNGDYRELAVIEVFRTLATLHASNDDCPSLIESNARALQLSKAAAMSWGTRRMFLLEWADCLLRRSGIGDGRSEEEFLSDAAASPVLSDEWGRFSRFASAFESDFAYPTGDDDARLLRNYRRSQIILGGTGSQ